MTDLATLSPGAVRYLRQMDDLPRGHDDSEIVRFDGDCYLGAKRISEQAFRALLGCGAIERASAELGHESYVITDAGRAIARRPDPD